MRFSCFILDLHGNDPNIHRLEGYDSSSSTNCPGGVGQRTKRMRTSFKHHQLRTMKSYFAINQNPDAKDLKQLAQKTGLSKRVLQVSLYIDP
jgi:LIM homeobox protein 2/9